MNKTREISYLIFWEIRHTHSYQSLNLYLSEHQSTINPNMPLRFLQYVSAEYEKLAASKGIYRDRLVQIPAPHFIVFCNGTASCPERQELRLSDAFLTKEDVPEVSSFSLLPGISPDDFPHFSKHAFRYFRFFLREL